MKPEELLAEALPLAKPWGGTGLDGMVFDESVDTEEWARAILAASPRLAAVMELGLAWEAAEKALPEGYRLTVIKPASAPNHWVAGCHAPDAKIPLSSGYQPTPATALRALAERLTNEGTK